MATWWSPFVDGPTSFVIPADPKGYIQLTTHFATPTLGEAIPSDKRFPPTPTLNQNVLKNRG
jgi:hypothetical protein